MPEIRELLQPQRCYRLADLAEHFQLPTEPIVEAVHSGEIPRSLGEGSHQMTLLGVDVADWCEEHNVRPRLTPEGREHLDNTPRNEVAVMQQTTASDSDVRPLPLSAIILSGRNPRLKFDDDGIGSLADSIRQVGLLQAIVVRPTEAAGEYELVCGERRLRAAEKLGWTDIPASIRELDDQQAAELRLLENLDREDLNPIEEAGALRQLRELGHDTASLANLIRRSESELEAREALLDLPVLWQSLVKSGELSVTAAEYLIPWIDHPSILDAMERHANQWPLALTEWKRRLLEIVRTLSRPMSIDDPSGPTFTADDETLERLDVVDVPIRPGKFERRAMNAPLWDECQDAADVAQSDPAEGDDEAVALATHQGDAGEPESNTGPVFDDAYWRRLATWKADWLRTLISRHLLSCDLDELTGFCELIGVEPSEEWTLSREFLQLHDNRQLHLLADDVGIDISDADNADEARAVLLHVQPEAMPSNVAAVDEHLVSPVPV